MEMIILHIYVLVSLKHLLCGFHSLYISASVQFRFLGEEAAKALAAVRKIEKVAMSSGNAYVNKNIATKIK